MSSIKERIIQKLNLTFSPLRIKGKNQLSNEGFTYNVKLKIQGENNSLHIAKGASVENLTISIVGNNNRLIIDENVKIKAGLFWFEDDFGTIEIGKNTTIEQVTLATLEGSKHIKIGEDCMISNGVDIRNSDSHSIIDLDTNQRTNHGESITIGNHVWIGANVSILKGVIIENNSIIAMGSVLTKDVECNTVYGGNPAKKIKSKVNWNRKLLP